MLHILIDFTSYSTSPYFLFSITYPSLWVLCNTFIFTSTLLMPWNTPRFLSFFLHHLVDPSHLSLIRPFFFSLSFLWDLSFPFFFGLSLSFPLLHSLRSTSFLPCPPTDLSFIPHLDGRSYGVIEVFHSSCPSFHLPFPTILRLLYRPMIKIPERSQSLKLFLSSFYYWNRSKKGNSELQYKILLCLSTSIHLHNDIYHTYTLFL